MLEPADITQLLNIIHNNPDASDRLYALVYDELKGIAHRHFRSERAGHTLQTTGLANEAYLKLVDQTRADWQNRAQFFAIASRAMRRILVDYARQRNRLKRGGDKEKVPLEFADHAASPAPTTDLVALDDALTRLREEAPVKCDVVEMRFFGGLNNKEIADVLGVSSRTVERHWRYAKAWLYRSLSGDPPQGAE